MSAPNLLVCGFLGSMEKRCSSNSLDFTFGGEDFQELLTQRQYRQLGLRGGLGVFLFGGFGIREFQKKWREKNERTQMDRKWTLYCFLLNQTVTIES